MDGFYATGHNPSQLTDNLRHTRLYVTVGDGTPAEGQVNPRRGRRRGRRSSRSRTSSSPPPSSPAST